MLTSVRVAQARHHSMACRIRWFFLAALPSLSHGMVPRRIRVRVNGGGLSLVLRFLRDYAHP